MTTIDDYFKGRLEESGNGDTLSHCPQIGEVERILREYSERGIEVTITFKPELRDRWNSKTLTRLVRDILLRHNKCKCMIIGEYSKVGVYHMHGSIIAAPRDIATLRRKMSREIGRTEFKAIKWVESWVKYCLKADEEVLGTKELYKDEIIMIT